MYPKDTFVTSKSGLKCENKFKNTANLHLLCLYNRTNEFLFIFSYKLEIKQRYRKT